jgi:hypothetical protein
MLSAGRPQPCRAAGHGLTTIGKRSSSDLNPGSIHFARIVHVTGILLGLRAVVAQ